METALSGTIASRVIYIYSIWLTFLENAKDGGSSGNEIGVNENGERDDGILFEPCCLAEPNVVCHYRDKPSKIPCTDKDPIDKGKPSFW